MTTTTTPEFHFHENGLDVRPFRFTRTCGHDIIVWVEETHDRDEDHERAAEYSLDVERNEMCKLHGDPEPEEVADVLAITAPLGTTMLVQWVNPQGELQQLVGDFAGSTSYIGSGGYRGPRFEMDTPVHTSTITVSAHAIRGIWTTNRPHQHPTPAYVDTRLF